jgi:potassium channel subfamily K
MGKINQEDITVVMELFRKLDCDQSGTLTEADIRNSEF